MTNLLCVSHEWSLGFEELRQLANAGFRVIPVSSGFEAVKEFATRDIDAVIMNRRLPDIPVGDLASYFRHHKDNAPIVIVSASTPVADAPEIVDAIINKHNCSELLVPTLQVLLSARTHESQSNNSLAQVA